MPVVPRLTRQVQTAALPGVRLTAAETPESEGAGIAEAQGQQAQALTGIGARTAAIGEGLYAKAIEEEKKRADEVALLNASSQLAQWENQRIYDPTKGALTVKGQAAFGLPEQVGQEYSDKADQIAASLTTDRQKQAFAKVRAERGIDLDGTMRKHTYAEIQQYQGQELQAFLDNSRNAAIANATDPRRVGVELQRQVDAITTHAPQLGIGPEALQKQIDATRSVTHVGVIENLLAQEQTKTAQIYFEETKSQINGDQIARIEKALQEGTLRKQSQQATDAIMDGTYGLRADGSQKGEGYFGALKRPDGQFSSELSIGVEINGKETEIPALVPTLTDKEVKTLLAQSPDAKIPDAIIEKATAYAKTRIAAGKSPFAGAGEANAKLAASVERAKPERPEPPATLREALEQAKAIDDPKLRDEVSARIEHAWNIRQVQERQDNESALRTAYDIVDRNKDVSRIPPTTWVSFSGADRSALRGYAERLARGEPTETDDATYYSLMLQASGAPGYGTAQDFVKQNLLAYRAKLSDGDFKHFVELQTQLRNGQTKAPALDDFRSTHDVMSSTLRSAGIDPTSKDNQAETARFYSLVAEEQRRAQAITQKPLSNQDMEDIANRVLARQIVDPGWFVNGTKRLISATVSDVPAAARKQIEDSLRRYGQPVTDDGVLNIWIQSQSPKAKP